MPTGQPDFFRAPGEEVETFAERVIREAIEAGDFDDLPGRGEPIPGAGTLDDEMWWVRSWVERNRLGDGQAPSSSR